ncbi:MAG: chemotaxis protein CheA [Nitrospirae bacterium]|nr:chemotaxis protein CheA [Nitrospirota bacterium]
MPDEMEEIIAEFITESEETLDRIDPLFVELEIKGEDKEMLNQIFRSVHTIKGAAGFLGFQPIVDVAHNAENIMKKLREGEIRMSKQLMDVVLKSVDMLRLLLKHVKQKDGVTESTAPLLSELKTALENATTAAGTQTSGARDQESGVSAQATDSKHVSPASELRTPTAEPATAPVEVQVAEKEALQTLRVDVGKIDKVMDLTGEVVLVRNRLLNIVNRLEHQYTDDHDVQSLLEAVSFLDLITSDMQLGVMKMRMQPIAKVFGKFPRLVRDISGPLGKMVNLKVSGEETEVDKSVIEQIGDPMVHIIRNAVDHGLETPQERRAKGKAEAGTISISAEQKGNQIVIEVSDDGRGVNLDRVKAKALKQNMISEEEAVRMTDEAAMNLILLPGFSTAEVATELSGRGVGMDVVKTNVSKLNGTVEITSHKDKGSTFTIRIPLTLAIIQTLMVRSGNARYAVPLAPVEETLMVAKEDISEMSGTDALVIRGKVYPLFRLTEILGTSQEKTDFKYAVVVNIADKRFCIGVDELLGQEEVVIKSVAGMNSTSSYLLGATITGDGRVVFILDLSALSRVAMGAVTV